eukprot:3479611-Amphidinium_carterae.2
MVWNAVKDVFQFPLLRGEFIPRHLVLRHSLVYPVIHEWLARTQTHVLSGFPSVTHLSLHLTERYACNGGDVLIMREGSLGRFSVTLRGRAFFAALAQFVTEASPFRFRQLAFTSRRLDYKAILQHRAAVFAPLVWDTKMTFKDRPLSPFAMHLNL